MTKRFINNIHNLEFKPFDNYGEPVKGMSWHKISYDKQNGGYGTYVLKMDPGAKSLSHVHQGPLPHHLALQADFRRPGMP